MKVVAVVHSKDEIEEVEMLEKRQSDYIVLTQDGTKCTAIWNPFVCLFYADDIYGIIDQAE